MPQNYEFCGNDFCQKFGYDIEFSVRDINTGEEKNITFIPQQSQPFSIQPDNNWNCVNSPNPFIVDGQVNNLPRGTYEFKKKIKFNTDFIEQIKNANYNAKEEVFTGVLGILDIDLISNGNSSGYTIKELLSDNPPTELSEPIDKLYELLPQNGWTESIDEFYIMTECCGKITIPKIECTSQECNIVSPKAQSGGVRYNDYLLNKWSNYTGFTTIDQYVYIDGLTLSRYLSKYSLGSASGFSFDDLVDNMLNDGDCNCYQGKESEFCKIWTNIVDNLDKYAFKKDENGNLKKGSNGYVEFDEDFNLIEFFLTQSGKCYKGVTNIAFDNGGNPGFLSRAYKYFYYDETKIYDHEENESYITQGMYQSSRWYSPNLCFDPYSNPPVAMDYCGNYQVSYQDDASNIQKPEVNDYFEPGHKKWEGLFQYLQSRIHTEDKEYFERQKTKLAEDFKDKRSSKKETAPFEVFLDQARRKCDQAIRDYIKQIEIYLRTQDWVNVSDAYFKYNDEEIPIDEVPSGVIQGYFSDAQLLCLAISISGDCYDKMKTTKENLDYLEKEKGWNLLDQLDWSSFENLFNSSGKELVLELPLINEYGEKYCSSSTLTLAGDG